MTPIALPYRAPYDWPALLAFLAPRATPGVESVADGRYARTLRLGAHTGVVAIAPGAGDTLEVALSPALHPARDRLVPHLRQLLDLGADPAAIGQHLATDATLAPLVRRRPGIRLPGALDPFDLALRAILGQQVSVRGATTLAGRLAALVGEPVPAEPFAPGLTTLPPAPARLADAGVDRVAAIGLPRTRAAALVALARATADGALPELATPAAPPVDPGDVARRLVALPGIGPWTAEYVAMRAFGDRDAFPAGDLALRRAMGDLSITALRQRADRWRPWRAYAALHLWASLGDQPSTRQS